MYRSQRIDQHLALEPAGRGVARIDADDRGQVAAATSPPMKTHLAVSTPNVAALSDNPLRRCDGT